MPGGRPSKYKPEFCEQIKTLMSQGASITEVAAEFGVDRHTINAWCEKHKEFSTARKEGEILSESWWMTKARNALNDRSFNAVLWYMNMKNRFGWKDTQRTEVTGKNGADLTPVINISLKKPNATGSKS